MSIIFTGNVAVNPGAQEQSTGRAGSNRSAESSMAGNSKMIPRPVPQDVSGESLLVHIHIFLKLIQRTIFSRFVLLFSS